MNPMNDTILAVTHLGQGQIDYRQDPRAAETLRERVELNRALQREQARYRRQQLFASIKTTARVVGQRLVAGKIGQAARRIGQGGLRPA